MELWIRSQDRERLIKVFDIWVDNEQVIANFQSHFNGCHYVDLGEYNSNSRALEVLDEIQKILNPKGILKFNGLIRKDDIKKIEEYYRDAYKVFDNSVEQVQQPDTYVYEMPEE